MALRAPIIPVIYFSTIVSLRFIRVSMQVRFVIHFWGVFNIQVIQVDESSVEMSNNLESFKNSE